MSRGLDAWRQGGPPPSLCSTRGLVTKSLDVQCSDAVSIMVMRTKPMLQMVEVSRRLGTVFTVPALPSKVPAPPSKVRASASKVPTLPSQVSDAARHDLPQFQRALLKLRASRARRAVQAAEALHQTGEAASICGVHAARSYTRIQTANRLAWHPFPSHLFLRRLALWLPVPRVLSLARQRPVWWRK